MSLSQEAERPLGGVARAFVGVIGGLAAAGVKYLGQDHPYLLKLMDLGGQEVKITNLVLSYAIMVPILVFLGAVAAWCSYESHRLKLIAIAVSAPALITTYAGGSTSGTKFAFDFISHAYAADVPVSTNNKVSVGNALKLFFGVGKDDERYYVIAGPYQNETAAAVAGKSLMREHPDVPVFAVDAPRKGAVIVIGNSLPYADAKSLRDTVKDSSALKNVQDVYLSANPPMPPAMRQ